MQRAIIPVCLLAETLKQRSFLAQPFVHLRDSRVKSLSAGAQNAGCKDLKSTLELCCLGVKLSCSEFSEVSIATHIFVLGKFERCKADICLTSL